MSRRSFLKAGAEVVAAAAILSALPEKGEGAELQLGAQTELDLRKRLSGIRTRLAEAHDKPSLQRVELSATAARYAAETEGVRRMMSGEDHKPIKEVHDEIASVLKEIGERLAQLGSK